jgi:hypothetical protein
MINNKAGLLMALLLYFIAGSSFCPGVPAGKGLVCAVGVQKGKAVKAGMGSEGGIVRSADDRVIITVPAGALTRQTTIEVAPISNTNPAGNGLAYRITPHGIRFQKPVSISFSYAGEKDQKRIPQLQGIAYQDENGVWKSVRNGAIDTAAKRITVYTSHFSDWSEFETMKLAPENPILATGQSAVIKAVQYVGNDELLQPLGPQGGAEVAIGSPHDLPVNKIKAWRLSGVGAIKPSGQKADYKAPAMIKGYTATAAVSLELNTTHGQVLLISNIVVMNEGITFRIDGGKWLHFKKNECGYDDMPNRIYAKDSLGASVMIDWLEKMEARKPWTTTAEGLSPSFVLHTEGNFTNYYSLLTVGEAAEEMASPGYIEFYHFPVSKEDYVCGYFLIERGNRTNAREEKLSEAKVEGYFFVRTKRNAE